MLDLLGAVAVAFGIVFVAELGDKTQLLALGFGARHPLRTVALGLTLGYGAAGLVAAAVGGILGSALPQRPIEIVGGVVFVVFAVLAVRDVDGNGDGDADAERAGVRRSPSVVASIALTIAVAEMGDKTQIATAALAARSNPIATWVGATAGAVASGMIGAYAGTMVGDRIPDAALRWASAVLFTLFGVAMLAGWP
ncbi:TMEM165/GDT1 family protein [Ilumatobacter sp.]|uniref:TMEM165/GDT1 family protein n=1 Tax=Ilumatobacter sp. TaxID=1967498 RepID=UPI003B51893B